MLLFAFVYRIIINHHCVENKKTLVDATGLMKWKNSVLPLLRWFVILLYYIDLFYAIVGGMCLRNVEYIHKNEISFIHFLLVGSNHIVCSSWKGKTIHYALYIFMWKLHLVNILYWWLARVWSSKPIDNPLYAKSFIRRKSILILLTH